MLESIIFRCFLNDPHVDFVKGLFDYLFGAESTEPSIDSMTAGEKIYISNILRFRKHISNRQYIDADPNRISSAMENTDFIVEQIPYWPLFKTINFALLLAIPPQNRSAVVTSIRNEGISILEWIAHNRAIGFDEIFIYTNNNTDGSTRLLEVLANQKIIRLINNTVDPSVPPQVKAYEHSIHFLPELRQFKWAFYMDADEFFIPRCEPTFTLDDFFQKLDARFDDHLPSAISFNWKWFGSQNAFEKTDGLLLRRFIHSIHNEHVKSLVQLDCVLSMKPLHCPVMFKDCSTVNSQLQAVPNMSAQIKPEYGLGQINHYWNKSFQEYVIKKFRGRGAVASTDSQRDFASFFDWGANGRIGNYDPPPDLLVSRTQAVYDELLALPGIRDELRVVSESFAKQISEIDMKLNLQHIYEQRGRT
jgi:hypothetical protein